MNTVQNVQVSDTKMFNSNSGWLHNILYALLKFKLYMAARTDLFQSPDYYLLDELFNRRT